MIEDSGLYKSITVFIILRYVIVTYDIERNSYGYTSVAKISRLTSGTLMLKRILMLVIVLLAKYLPYEHTKNKKYFQCSFYITA